jgi:hypothetical protein
MTACQVMSCLSVVTRAINASTLAYPIWTAGSGQEDSSVEDAVPGHRDDRRSIGMTVADTLVGPRMPCPSHRLVALQT